MGGVCQAPLISEIFQCLYAILFWLHLNEFGPPYPHPPPKCNWYNFGFPGRVRSFQFIFNTLKIHNWLQMSPWSEYPVMSMWWLVAQSCYFSTLECRWVHICRLQGKHGLRCAPHKVFNCTNIIPMASKLGWHTSSVCFSIDTIDFFTTWFQWGIHIKHTICERWLVNEVWSPILF